MTLLPRRVAHPDPRRPAPPRRWGGGAIVPAALLAAVALLTGCGTVGQVAKVVASSAASAFDSSPGPAWMSWDGLLLQAAADANQNTPVALDIVFVRDLELLNTLQGLSAARWFAGRTDLQRTHPEGLQVYSVEVVPHQSLRLSERMLGAPRVSGVLLFADYLNPGEHRQRLPRDTPGAVVNLGPQGFTVGPLRSNKP